MAAPLAPYHAVAAEADRLAAVQPMAVEEQGLSGNAKRQLEEALQSLKSTKRVDRVAAERALASIDDFREAKRNRQPPQPLNNGLDGCVAAPNPACLLEEALAHAYRVPDQGRRDWALSAVATVYYETGAIGRVYSAAALMEDPRAALRLLEQTVGADDRPAGRLEHASEDLPRDDGPEADWTAAAQAGDWHAARRAIDAIAESRYRAVALARYARMAIDAGETALAEEALNACEGLITAIDFAYAKSFARYEASLTHIARVAQSKGGTPETRQAAAAAARIDQPHFRADAFWRLADVGAEDMAPGIRRQAEASFDEIASRLRQVFVLTSEEPKSADRQARALRIAASITDPLDRARAFTRLARYIR